jgi:hypothetical protein
VTSWLQEIANRCVLIALCKVHVEVFWDVTPCSVVVGYQRFRGPWCLHLQGEGITTYKTLPCP